MYSGPFPTPSSIPAINYIDHDSVGLQDKLPPRIISSVLSCLSIIGASLIILSYIFIKSIRTKAREVLFHLSLADLGVGLTNLIGATVDYGSLIKKCHSHSNGTSLHGLCFAYLQLCKTQAFFAEFFTIASILWTLVLAFYVYILVLDTGRRNSLWIVRFGYVVCWGLPLLMSIWFVLTKKLGKTVLGGAGWCSLRVESHDGDIRVHFFTVFFGSDLWVMMTFLLILVLYTTTHCHLKEKVNLMKRRSNLEQFNHNSSDTKFLAIPFFFLFLRLGSVIVSILFVYANIWSSLPTTLKKVIFYYMVLGDSSDGLVNGIIFCFLTPRIRQKLYTFCCRKKGSLSVYGNQQQKGGSLFRSGIIIPPAETSEQRRLLENTEVSVHSNYKYSLNPSISTSPSSSDSEEYN